MHFRYCPEFAFHMSLNFWPTDIFPSVESCDEQWCGCDWSWKEMLLVLLLACPQTSWSASRYIFRDTHVSWSHFPMGVANHWNLRGCCQGDGNCSDEDVEQGGD